MSYTTLLTDKDYELIHSRLDKFIPEEIYDIHAHPYNPAHFSTDAWPFLSGIGVLGCDKHRSEIQRYMPSRTIHGLYFGMPHRSADRVEMNKWVRRETIINGSPLSLCLKVVTPNDNPKEIAFDLRNGMFCGLKVYHIYAARPDTMNASVTEYAPEWMWEILHETNGVLMLHIVRNGAIDDPDNQKELRRLCKKYSNVKLVLAHIARSFNYRNGRSGLQALAEFDNVVVDTSAICETESFKAALNTFGPRRILWGSDFAVSELRGRCVTTGGYFYWLHPEILSDKTKPPTDTEMTLVGIESLLCLREMSDDSGLTQSDIKDIFLNNALRLLTPHLKGGTGLSAQAGPEMWKHAREVISGGTGLLSKRAELYDPTTWPSYFSRCLGCEVWDMNDRRYIDFAGGIGAVLLGYADPDVNAAVTRRLSAGTYCSLVNPQEVELADLLLSLHPWAGKVRFGRSGGEAMAQAVRIARASTGKSGVAFCGYHGWHDWYLAANIGESNALDGHLLPGLEPKGVPRELKGTSVPFLYNDLASLDAALAKLDGNLATVVMEPMRSQIPADDFVAKVAAKCRAAGAVFIVDEITSGLRYGFPGALSKIGVDPDIVVYAKAMSNGFPFAAILGREEVMKEGESSFISSSYWTDGVGTAAALAVMRKASSLHSIMEKKGLELQSRLRDIAADYPACKILIGGMPATPTIAFKLDEDSKAAHRLYVRKMQENGILVSSIFYLMLAHEDKHIEHLLNTIPSVFGEIQEIILSGNLQKEAGAGMVQSGFARLA